MAMAPKLQRCTLEPTIKSCQLPRPEMRSFTKGAKNQLHQHSCYTCNCLKNALASGKCSGGTFLPQHRTDIGDTILPALLLEGVEPMKSFPNLLA